MNLSDYTFVALDLETTGLDPTKETIIEIAAIRFQLERDGDIFRAINREERSMLINPGKPMTEEISMITGITDSMLLEKPVWKEVRERVEAFIGGSIIVGHNVLFDISMLRTHGINLSEHITLDTFELSEIFSQDAESLNLGFLGKKYHIPADGEHRALDDTKLSVELFLIYLSEISLLNDDALSLWGLARTHDTSGVFQTLLSLVEIPNDIKPYTLPIFPLTLTHTKEEEETRSTPAKNPTLISLSGSREEEIQIITNALEEKSPLLILTPNQKQSEYFAHILSDTGYQTLISRKRESFCSIEMLSYFIREPQWKRKDAIFLVKILTWIGQTHTGLLDELHYYGDERELIHLFRAGEDEENPFFLAHNESLQNAKIILADIYRSDIDSRSILNQDHSLIVKDIIPMEDALRRQKSTHISFAWLFSTIEHDCESILKEAGLFDTLITGLSIISDIFTDTPSRPKGENIFPPGAYGETYFLTQAELWQRGYRWLIFGAEKLTRSREIIDSLISQVDLKDQWYLKKLQRDLQILIDISYTKRPNTSIVMTIHPADTKISFIPRDIKDHYSRLLDTQRGSFSSLLLGYGIGGSETKRFLEEECGITGDMKIIHQDSQITFSKNIDIAHRKTVILTTSTKHIRLLAKELKGKYNIQNLYAQGISGGKGKMMTLFQKAEEKSVLIGLIDSYIDESEIWQGVDMLIIAKVPFDPPTDAYFLARTVGMKNNFEQYSTPIALSTLNTLIGRVRFAHPDTKIVCIDERLDTMLWGKNIKNNLL